jgi:hypothetical protein
MLYEVETPSPVCAVTPVRLFLFCLVLLMRYVRHTFSKKNPRLAHPVGHPIAPPSSINDSCVLTLPRGKAGAGAFDDAEKVDTAATSERQRRWRCRLGQKAESVAAVDIIINPGPGDSGRAPAVAMETAPDDAKKILPPAMRRELMCACRDGDDEGGGGEALRVAEPQVQGPLRELDQLPPRLPDRGLPLGRVRHSTPRTEHVLLQEALLASRRC